MGWDEELLAAGAERAVGALVLVIGTACSLAIAWSTGLLDGPDDLVSLAMALGLVAAGSVLVVRATRELSETRQRRDWAERFVCRGRERA